MLVILILLCVRLFTINTDKEENAYFKYDFVSNYASDILLIFSILITSYIKEHKCIIAPAINLYVSGFGVKIYNNSEIDGTIISIMNLSF